MFLLNISSSAAEKTKAGSLIEGMLSGRELFVLEILTMRTVAGMLRCSRRLDMDMPINLRTLLRTIRVIPSLFIHKGRLAGSCPRST